MFSGVGALANTDLLVQLAQSGDVTARNRLIEEARSFVHRTASACCRRTLDWRNDDELSIALIALNEAIDSFVSGEQREFYAHARRVITHRLIDHFRREGRHIHLAMEATMETGADKQVAASLETEAALAAYDQAVESQCRLEDISVYNRLLGVYGLSLKDLKKHCPKHKDTRQRLTDVAKALAKHPSLVDRFRRTGQLPLRELESITGISRKVLETGRRYIVALTVLLLHEDLTYLRSFAGLSTERGEG